MARQRLTYLHSWLAIVGEGSQTATPRARSRRSRGGWPEVDQAAEHRRFQLAIAATQILQSEHPEAAAELARLVWGK